MDQPPSSSAPSLARHLTLAALTGMVIGWTLPWRWRPSPWWWRWTAEGRACRGAPTS